MNAVVPAPTSAAICHSPDFCLYSIRYAVTPGPRLPAGAAHFTYKLVSEAGAADTLLGEPGLTASTSAVDSSVGVALASLDGSPVPTEFIALTRNVYSVSSSRPSIVYSVLVFPVLELASSYSSSSSSASLYSIL